MKYLPILQELFESDTFIFMIIGIVVAVIIGVRLKEQKRLISAIITSLIIYGICEAVSNIHTNFMLEIVLLFVGTVGLGCGVGFIICFLIKLIKSRRNRL